MLGRRHAKAGSIKTEKSGFTLEVPVIIPSELQAILDVGPCGDLAFICGERGEPLTKESFGNMFRDACKAAGVPGSAHGVRKLAATVMAEHGVTDHQLMAVFGWNDPKMASHYTRTANRRRLAAQAFEKLANAGRTSIPAPSHPVRARGAKQ
jgi:integrase